jgi:chromosome segregation ATPase
LQAFTTHRKALETSIQKNKRFEEQNAQLLNKNRELVAKENITQMQIESLESELKSLQQRFKRERETLSVELDDKKSQILRYSSELKETQS